MILGHENPDVDSIISGYLLERLLTQKGVAARFIIPDKVIDDESANLCLKYGLNPVKYQKQVDFSNPHQQYFLVDHNSREVAGKIIGIIDHHPTQESIECEYYVNQPASSTTCLICQEQEKYFTSQELELACLGAFVDTASFKSTKARKEDQVWVSEMIQKCNFDYEKLYEDGLCLTSLDNLEQASFKSLKKYVLAGERVEASTIQIENPLEKIEEIGKMLQILKEYVRKQNLNLFVFIVHDMTFFQTRTYLIFKNTISIKDYEQYTSRGTKIIPDVELEIQKKMIKK